LDTPYIPLKRPAFSDWQEHTDFFNATDVPFSKYLIFLNSFIGMGKKNGNLGYKTYVTAYTRRGESWSK